MLSDTTCPKPSGPSFGRVYKNNSNAWAFDVKEGEAFVVACVRGTKRPSDDGTRLIFSPKCLPGKVLDPTDPCVERKLSANVISELE